MKTAVFDLDGTLVDTSGDMLAAANGYFEAQGIGAPLCYVRDAHIGVTGGRAMLEAGSRRSGFEISDFDEAYREFLGRYSANLHVRSVVYDGVNEALTLLRAQGWILTICTNKPENMAERLLDALDLRAPFRALIGADTLPIRKPDPNAFREAVIRAGGDVQQSVMIGDTQTDHDTARAAGVPSILVDFGMRDVRRFEPDGIMTHYGELAEMLEEIMSNWGAQ